MIRYPCPSCNAQRESVSAVCQHCGWPRGATPYLRSMRSCEIPIIQWRLRSMFWFMTIACGTFALVGRFGLEGFWARLVAGMIVASVFTPLLLFYLFWRASGFDKMN